MNLTTKSLVDIPEQADPLWVKNPEHVDPLWVKIRSILTPWRNIFDSSYKYNPPNPATKMECSITAETGGHCATHSGGQGTGEVRSNNLEYLYAEWGRSGRGCDY